MEVHISTFHTEIHLEKQFLTLVFHAHRPHIGKMRSEVAHRLRNVDHRRRLDVEPLGVCLDGGKNAQHIGRTVGKPVKTRSAIATACRVDKHSVETLIGLREPRHRIGIHHREGIVVRTSRRYFLVEFDSLERSHSLRNVVGVNAKPHRHIEHAVGGLEQRGMELRHLLVGALLCADGLWKEETLVCQQFGNFVFRFLATFNLHNGKPLVEGQIRFALQHQLQGIGSSIRRHIPPHLLHVYPLHHIFTS